MRLIIAIPPPARIGVTRNLAEDAFSPILHLSWSSGPARRNCLLFLRLQKGCPRMVILELNKVRPLDILLTSGDQKFSKSIRAATTLARRGRLAAFSHAALFLSPSLLVESLFNEGISITNLIEPAMKGHQSAEQLFTSRAIETLSARIDRGRLRLFVILEGESGAAVFRHKSIDQNRTDLLTLLIRPRVFALLQCCYRAQYPELGRLLNVFHSMPLAVREAAEKFLRLMEAEKVAPGPFCSELVQTVFTALADFLPTKQVDPLGVAPDDLAVSEDFRRLDGDERPITIATSLGELPGKPGDPGFVAQMKKMLVGEVLRSQELEGKIIQINGRLATLVPWLNRTDVGIERERYAKLSMETRAKWLKHIEEFVRIGCDSLWNWIEDANECRITCPAQRLARGDKVLWPPPDDPHGVAELKWIASGRKTWEMPRYWDGNACSDVRECACAGSTWEQVWSNYLYEVDAQSKRDYELLEDGTPAE